MLLIAVTGLGDPINHCRSLEAGFALHLLKPFDLDEFHELLATLGKERAR